MEQATEEGVKEEVFMNLFGNFKAWQTQSMQSNIRRMEANIEILKKKNTDSEGRVNNIEAINRLEENKNRLKKLYPEK